DNFNGSTQSRILDSSTGTLRTEGVAFDASAFAIELLRDGTVTQVIAQKPGDMGYFAVINAVADARGVSSFPKRLPTGYAVMNIDNVDDPEISRFIYREE
ncbi:MAG: hypothetical protein AAFR22_07125, partial [Chloroflexota bacterium]